MKRIFLILLLLIMSLAIARNNPYINCTFNNTAVYQSPGVLGVEVKGSSLTTENSLIWYAYNIGGYTSFDFYGGASNQGGIPTTLSVQPIYANGETCGAAYTHTAGTATTAFKSNNLKFILAEWPTGDATVSLNFLFRD